MKHSLIILTSLLIFFNSFQALSFQNLDQVLADPDVTWVGEIYVDYHTNINILEPENEETKNRHETIDYNAIEVLKIQQKVSEDHLSPIPSLFAEKIFQLHRKTLNIYEDAALTEKLSYNTYQSIINQEVEEVKITIDPETYQQIVKVFKLKLGPKNIEQFRLKQILSYHAKTNKLKITPIAIAPLQSINKFGERLEVALFWMPIKQIFETIDLSKPSISWAKRFDKGIALDSINIIKGTSDLPTIFIKMIAEYRAEPNTPNMYKVTGENKQLVALKPEYVQKFGVELDTIISFDPETREEVIQVVSDPLLPSYFKKINLIQDWIWDDKIQAMQIRNVAFSPILYREDYNGNYWYTPCYLIKIKE